MSALDIEVRDIRFKISSRLWNCLMAENMDTLGDVVELAGYDWLRVPGFGRLALKELEDFLATQGLQLKSGPTPFKVRAADRIEKLEEENGVLFAANVRLNSRADLDGDHYRDRIEKLEAALREIDAVKYYGMEGAEMECREMHEIACKALKELDHE